LIERSSGSGWLNECGDISYKWTPLDALEGGSQSLVAS
jgi:hypothetical protein